MLPLAPVVLSAQKGTDLSIADLQSAVRSYAPGKSFLVGIHFKIKPGWHIYWRNPGDSGQEVRVKWALPAGWKASEIIWPTPRVLVDTGIVNYGYESEITLLARLTPSTKGRSGKVVANLQWLVCDKARCIPAYQVVKLSLGSSPSAAPNPSSATRLAAEEKSLQPTVTVMKAAAENLKKSIKFNVTFSGLKEGNGGQKIRFFPYDPTLIANEADQSYQIRDHTLAMVFPKSEFYDPHLGRLRGDLVGMTSIHIDFRVRIDVPLVGGTQ